jgi:hypothetical protein
VIDVQAHSDLNTLPLTPDKNVVCTVTNPQRSGMRFFGEIEWTRGSFRYSGVLGSHGNGTERPIDRQTQRLTRRRADYDLISFRRKSERWIQIPTETTAVGRGHSPASAATDSAH